MLAVVDPRRIHPVALGNKPANPKTLLATPFLAALEVLQQLCGSLEKLQENRDAVCFTLDQHKLCQLQRICATFTLLSLLILCLCLSCLLNVCLNAQSFI